MRAITFHCTVSRALKQCLQGVKMGEFEFDTDLLISVVEARPVLWNKTDDIYKDRKKPKKAWKEVCFCLQDDFEVLGDV